MRDPSQLPPAAALAQLELIPPGAPVAGRSYWIARGSRRALVRVYAVSPVDVLAWDSRGARRAWSMDWWLAMDVQEVARPVDVPPQYRRHARRAA